MYPEVLQHIQGSWAPGSDSHRRAVLNPATGEPLGEYVCVSKADLDRALAASLEGFRIWSRVSAFERCKIMRRAAGLLRERASEFAAILTLELGKPPAEAAIEVQSSADIVEWFAEEGRRAYGQVIPARADLVQQVLTREPVGPVAAFTPWNFPINQPARKISAALAAGCSVILKPAEETPATAMELVRIFLEAGVPPTVIGFVVGEPSTISEHLISSPIIRKISFTGSTAIGRRLSALAGEHLKRTTMELGGHAPAIVWDDADTPAAVRVLAAAKFRNAGQVCISPTRFLVHDSVFDAFSTAFVAFAKGLDVGPDAHAGGQMGPLAHARRLEAVDALVQDAVARGADLACGGRRIGNRGFFYAPTVLRDVPMEARIMNEEAFGPVAVLNRTRDVPAVIEEANRLDYGLAAYAFTGSAKLAATFGREIEAGMISINHSGLALPELHFGGVKSSGHGSEGGSEALEAYFNLKLVTTLAD
ncbi:NAD-dependent succinate-semialdehyde dehydrogenase [Phenylobacterium sp.]|jgi:succinate-semialdehyde dehydrogenase/glutarate-semialdehyde dehydrogenase|uniref:NAD-dependent succinate-semialdehyde dehydrogenase n=1 Tax=Phenylobacterium sp. TaxID=1871053 RepID=UPI002E300593|nr:NAD-dependent succinate-semialdehyde dehydrogenase [Phenylobacterium sp.]HEX3364622.1 NAD-dependent succinate-semialdehyde dehydrogenase [Phenylobacterium sp.]